MARSSLTNYKASQKRKSTKRLKDNSYPRDLVIVAEGDSWFDYPARKDVLDFLIADGYAIKRFSRYGDTLDNMVYGSKYGKNKRTGKITHEGPVSLQEVHNAVKKYDPKFFLLSAGGNDIVGEEIISYLNHKNSKPKHLLNKAIFTERLRQMSIAIEFYIKGIHRKNKNCHILMDGYAYPKVSGKPYRFAGIKIKGPWIEKSMAEKAILVKKYQNEIVKELVDGFNDMLAELSDKYSYFHHIDIRDKFPDDADWHNEIHLNKKAYRQLATYYSDHMTEILKYDPVEKHDHVLMA